MYITHTITLHVTHNPILPTNTPTQNFSDNEKRTTAPAIQAVSIISSCHPNTRLRVASQSQHLHSQNHATNRYRPASARFQIETATRGTQSSRKRRRGNQRSTALTRACEREGATGRRPDSESKLITIRRAATRLAEDARYARPWRVKIFVLESYSLL